MRLHLSTDLPLLRGDRFVLRESGRDETVGGGEVLDVAPTLPASKARPDADTDRLIAEHGWIDADDLAAFTGERREPTLGRWVVAPDALETTRSARARPSGRRRARWASTSPHWTIVNAPCWPPSTT